MQIHIHLLTTKMDLYSAKARLPIPAEADRSGKENQTPKLQPGGGEPLIGKICRGQW